MEEPLPMPYDQQLLSMERVHLVHVRSQSLLLEEFLHTQANIRVRIISFEVRLHCDLCRNHAFLGIDDGLYSLCIYRCYCNKSMAIHLALVRLVQLIVRNELIVLPSHPFLFWILLASSRIKLYSSHIFLG